MTLDKFKSAVLHFGLGMTSAAWNGGISSVAAILGIDAVAISGADAAALPIGQQTARVLNVHEMLSAFLGACIIHAVMWLKAHPLPETYDDTNPPIPRP